MTPILQSEPLPGKPGDCFRACIASLLDLQRAEVPHFYAGTPPGGLVPADAEADMRAWFARRDLALVCVPIRAVEADDVIAAWGSRNPDLHVIVCGQSLKGREHAVVCRDGQIVHDPSGTRHGLHGPQADGCYRVFLIGLAV